MLSAGATSLYPGLSLVAWVWFDVTTGTKRKGQGVSSVTRTAAGDYTINFSTAMASTNYVVHVEKDISQGGGYMSVGVQDATRTTTSVRVTTAQAGALSDGGGGLTYNNQMLVGIYA